MMYLKGITAIFICFSYVHLSNTIECTKGPSVSNGAANSSSLSCHGDFCTAVVVETGGKTPFLNRGCISGYPNVQPGCVKEHGLNICFCNSSKQCDNPDVLSLSKNVTTNHEIQCNDGVFLNGTMVKNRTCTGNYCIFGTTTRKGDSQSGYAGCVNEGFSHQFKGSYCLTVASDETSIGGLPPLLACTCDKNLCNVPSAFQGSDKVKKIKCEFGFFKINSTSDSTASQNCTGQYCYTQTAVRPGYDFEKGCVHFFDRSKLFANKSEILLLGRTFQTHYCDKDFCNREHNKFFNEKHSE